jgi:uncharacterized protein YgiM (DUF1202 family)
MKLKQIFAPVWLALLLLLLASSLVQAYSAQYYITPSSVSLRECPSSGCAPLLTVYQGEKVDILERTSTGWSRVSLVERPAIGWIPNNFLSYSQDLQAKPVPPYYVNVSSVPLRDKPNPNSNTIKTLHLHEQVEMLGVGTSGWAQVRELQTSLVGWVAPRYLTAGSPGSYHRAVRHRRTRVRKAPPEEEKKAPAKTPSPPSVM